MLKYNCCTNVKELKKNPHCEFPTTRSEIKRKEGDP